MVSNTLATCVGFHANPDPPVTDRLISVVRFKRDCSQFVSGGIEGHKGRVGVLCPLTPVMLFVLLHSFNALLGYKSGRGEDGFPNHRSHKWDIFGGGLSDSNWKSTHDYLLPL